MSNPMDEIGRFRDDIDRMSQRFEQAHAALGPVTGEDGTRSVRVTLDAAGLVSDVRVGRGWADHLTADTLGMAVSEAIAGALGSRTQQWATEFAEQEREPSEPVLRPAPTPGDSLAGQLTEVARQDAAGPSGGTLDAVLEMLTTLNESIDEVSAQVREQLGTSVAGRSSLGHVRATVTGAGDVTDLDYEAGWTGRAHPTNIGRETTEALRDAYRQIATTSTRSIIDASPLGRLRELTDDPVALARRLHLRD